MADIPQPLRRLPVRKMPADSRYVSLFSDASNKSDITFSDGHKGLLPKSTKLDEVGVDNLTLSLNGLSMLTPSKTEPIILEVIALHQSEFHFRQPTNVAGFPGRFPTPGRVRACSAIVGHGRLHHLQSDRGPPPRDLRNE